MAKLKEKQVFLDEGNKNDKIKIKMRVSQISTVYIQNTSILITDNTPS